MEILVQPSNGFQKQQPATDEEARQVEIPLDDHNPHNEGPPKSPGGHEDVETGKAKENGTIDGRTKSPCQHGSHFDTIFFNDGKRLIDFVLVYVSGHLKKADISRAGRVIEKEKQRLYFEENLRKDGLELEEDVHVHDGPHGETTTFVKVHAPWTVLCRQAEILKLKQPTRLNDPYADAPLSDGPSSFLRALRAVKDKAMRRFDANGPSGEPHSNGAAVSAPSSNTTCITWPFSRKYIELFAIDDKETFFWPTRRHEMVWEVLQNAHNDPDDPEKKRGIESLLERGIYESAFPLHDGPYELAPDQESPEKCERRLLKRTWADWRCVFDPQPLPLIRK